MLLWVYSLSSTSLQGDKFANMITQGVALG